MLCSEKFAAVVFFLWIFIAIHSDLDAVLDYYDFIHFMPGGCDDDDDDTKAVKLIAVIVHNYVNGLICFNGNFI